MKAAHHTTRTTPKPAGPRCGYPATWGEVKLAATIIAACAAAAFRAIRRIQPRRRSRRQRADERLHHYHHGAETMTLNNFHDPDIRAAHQTTRTARSSAFSHAFANPTCPLAQAALYAARVASDSADRVLYDNADPADGATAATAAAQAAETARACTDQKHGAEMRYDATVAAGHWERAK